MPVKQDGGALRGGAPRVVWFSSGSDPRVVSARSVAADLMREQTPAHLVWNPCSGEIVQLVPVTRAAGLLGDTVGHEGRVCVQVMVVGHAHSPFTSTVLRGLEGITDWLDAWGVRRRWPAGPPLPSPQSYDSRRDRRAWARGGHFGASQVPGLHRPDPGGIDIRRITGPDTPITAVPRRRPIPGQGRPRPVPPRENPADVAVSPDTAAPPGVASPQDAPDPVLLQQVAEAAVTANGGRVAVPLPRTAHPLGAVVAVAQHHPLGTTPDDTAGSASGEDSKAVSLYPGTPSAPSRVSAPLATSAPSSPQGTKGAKQSSASPASNGAQVPEPASMRS